jgi:hypothetical protein
MEKEEIGLEDSLDCVTIERTSTVNKIISGGQNGADLAGLEAAVLLGNY